MLLMYVPELKHTITVEAIGANIFLIHLNKHISKENSLNKKVPSLNQIWPL